MDIDVRALMLRLFERQKEYVVEDREQYGEAMVTMFTEDNQSLLMYPKFDDSETKILEYAAVVEKAKRERAVLIVTVNGGRSGLPNLLKDMGDGQWVDFNETNSIPCILITASGPGLRSCSLSAEYSISGTEVVFAEPEFSHDVEVSLLPDWP